MAKYKALVKRGLAKNPVLNSMSIRQKISRVRQLRDFRLSYNEVSFYFRGRKVRFLYRTENELEDIIDILKENFLDDQYRSIDVSGKDLVDIGAGIGDTAIYFAINGARHVYAYEPFPYRYKIAVKNVLANKLGKLVTLANEGCTGENTTIKVSNTYKSGAGSSLSQGSRGQSIRIRSLEHVVKKFRLKNAVLKLDCEGCEYDVILKSSSNTLASFSSMIIEYHYGQEALVKHLRDCGFSVKFTEPRPSYNVEEKRHMRMGIITAVKN